MIYSWATTRIAGSRLARCVGGECCACRSVGSWPIRGQPTVVPRRVCRRRLQRDFGSRVDDACRRQLPRLAGPRRAISAGRWNWSRCAARDTGCRGQARLVAVARNGVAVYRRPFHNDGRRGGRRGVPCAAAGGKPVGRSRRSEAEPPECGGLNEPECTLVVNVLASIAYSRLRWMSLGSASH